MRAIAMAAGVIMAAMPAMAQDLVAKVSPHDVVTTMDRLESAVEEAGAEVSPASITQQGPRRSRWNCVRRSF